jgi:prepilin-type N-terminal cleavage/methylation domain-containing protein
MKTNKTNQAGFSLIELLVVVIIIASLSAIAIRACLQLVATNETCSCYASLIPALS